MSEIKVNKISPSTGTDLDLGDSGDSIKVPSGGFLKVNNIDVVAVAPSTSGKVLTSDGTDWTSATPAASGLTLHGIDGVTRSQISVTAVSPNVDITGIPSGVSMIVLGFMGMSMSSTSTLSIYIGDSSGLSGANYKTGTTLLRASAYPATWDTYSNWLIAQHHSDPAFTYNGSMVITKMDTSANVWVQQHSLYMSSSHAICTGGGSHTGLSGELDRIRLRAGGLALDAGHVNISYI